MVGFVGAVEEDMFVAKFDALAAAYDVSYV
jgi:hypothetical protein